MIYLAGLLLSLLLLIVELPAVPLPVQLNVLVLRHGAGCGLTARELLIL